MAFCKWFLSNYCSIWFCYILYNVYKSLLFCQVQIFSGVIAGIGSIFLGIMGLLGKIDVVQIIKDIFNI